MPDKDQIYIFNNNELSLIKNTFADNDILLYTVRKVFLQFPLTDAEKGLLKAAMTPAVINVLKKRMLPELSPVFPLGQIPSILTTLSQDIKTKGVEDMAAQFSAKKLELDYLAQQFDKLADLEAEEAINLAELGYIKADAEMTYIKMTAYLFLLGYIDPMLIMIKTIAGSKEETLEEQNNRMKRDSNK